MVFWPDRVVRSMGVACRMQACWFETAERIFLDGSTPWEVDEAMTTYGFSRGPFEWQDQIGLDHVASQRQMWCALDLEPRRPSLILDRMLELGKLGQRTGAGWYRYPGGGGAVDDPIVADLALEEAHFASLTRTDYNLADIQHRMAMALCAEAAACLHVADPPTSEYIDAACREGIGFPAERGGPVTMARDLGPTQLRRAFEALAAEDPVSWAIAPSRVATLFPPA